MKEKKGGRKENTNCFFLEISLCIGVSTKLRQTVLGNVILWKTKTGQMNEYSSSTHSFLREVFFFFLFTYSGAGQGWLFTYKLGDFGQITQHSLSRALRAVFKKLGEKPRVTHFLFDGVRTIT